MLNNIGASTEPWGTPFLRRRSLLCWPSLVWGVKLRLVSISIMKPTMCRSGIVCRSLRWSQRSQTVSYAAVRSKRMMPAFSPRWKESSMSWVRRVTWSTVDFLRLKPACSCSSFGSITDSRRGWRRHSKILYGTQNRAMGWYPFGSSSGLLGFGRAMTLAHCHIFRSLDVRKQREQNDRSHSVVLLHWCRMNSGWMLSIPAALFGFRCLIADFISSLVNSPERLASMLGALLMSFTSPMVFLVNSLSTLRNLPLLISCAAMESAVMGHGFGFCLLMVCHARGLEWVKSIDSTVLVHLSLSVCC